ncbi:uncharacterized protein A4U43_C10F18330 [Asparagus officinalis]|uniref:CCHC-type domain-containing protein n=1 Tax=Asparagus officinalis TaxID=4686 RepID=A0A5P1E418_ASPOF|nr:uncharacterized protein A4U43_C10F18330 [Asparagus officinalis]
MLKPRPEPSRQAKFGQLPSLKPESQPGPEEPGSTGTRPVVERHCKGSDHPKRGCFKCGATDHIARHCRQGANNKQLGPEYILKNDQTQQCGDGRKRSLVKSRADEKSEDREYIDHNRSSRSNHRYSQKKKQSPRS